MTKIDILIKSLFPSKGEIDVSLDVSPVIGFNYAMKRETLTEENIYLEQNGVKVKGMTLSYSGLNRALTIIPAEPLLPTTAYAIVIKGEGGALENSVGNKSRMNYTIPFTTGSLPEEEVPEEPLDPEGGIGVEIPVVPEVPETEPTPAPTNQIGILNSYPEDGEILSPNTPIAVAFNASIKEDGLDKHIKLVERPLSPLLPEGSNVGIQIAIDKTGSIVRITPTVPLFEGTEYDLIFLKGMEATATSAIKGSLDSDLALSFISGWKRTYTTIKAVRRLSGSFGTSFTDKDISEMIAQESESLYWKFSRTKYFKEEEWSDGKAPFGASQYVLYSVVYTMALGQTLETSAGVKKSITLGDLQVGGASTVSSSIGNILKLLKDELDGWWDTLKGIEPGVKFASLTAGTARTSDTTSTYPDFLQRVPFKGIGG